MAIHLVIHHEVPIAYFLRNGNGEDYTATQKAEGRAEGHKEGRRESQAEIIRNMAKSLSPEEIANLTGIALSTIREILVPAAT